MGPTGNKLSVKLDTKKVGWRAEEFSLALFVMLDVLSRIHGLVFLMSAKLA